MYIWLYLLDIHGATPRHPRVYPLIAIYPTWGKKKRNQLLNADDVRNNPICVGFVVI